MFYDYSSIVHQNWLSVNSRASFVDAINPKPHI